MMQNNWYAYYICISGTIYRGDTMKDNKDMLSSIVKTAQMGQVGIRSVLPYATDSKLKSALCSQKREYDKIEREAYAIAKNKGWHITELSPVVKLMSNAYADTRLMIHGNDSKIAAMMINGNTRGIIKGLKNKHHSESIDKSVIDLSQKLLDCENENIRQMQGYV